MDKKKLYKGQSMRVGKDFKRFVERERKKLQKETGLIKISDCDISNMIIEKIKLSIKLKKPYNKITLYN